MPIGYISYKHPHTFVYACIYGTILDRHFSCMKQLIDRPFFAQKVLRAIHQGKITEHFTTAANRM